MIVWIESGHEHEYEEGIDMFCFGGSRLGRCTRENGSRWQQKVQTNTVVHLRFTAERRTVCQVQVPGWELRNDYLAERLVQRSDCSIPTSKWEINNPSLISHTRLRKTLYWGFTLQGMYAEKGLDKMNYY